MCICFVVGGGGIVVCGVCSGGVGIGFVGGRWWDTRGYMDEPTRWSCSRLHPNYIIPSQQSPTSGTQRRSTASNPCTALTGPWSGRCRARSRTGWRRRWRCSGACSGAAAVAVPVGFVLVLVVGWVRRREEGGQSSVRVVIWPDIRRGRQASAQSHRTPNQIDRPHPSKHHNHAPSRQTGKGPTPSQHHRSTKNAPTLMNSNGNVIKISIPPVSAPAAKGCLAMYLAPWAAEGLLVLELLELLSCAGDGAVAVVVGLAGGRAIWICAWSGWWWRDWGGQWSAYTMDDWLVCRSKRCIGFRLACWLAELSSLEFERRPKPTR